MKNLVTLSQEIRFRILTMISDTDKNVGDKIPSIRSLSNKFSCSHMTTVKIIKQLIDEGFLESKNKSGIFIKHKPDKFSVSNRRTISNKLYFIYYTSALEIDTYHIDILQYITKYAIRNNWELQLIELENNEKVKSALNDKLAVGIILPSMPRGGEFNFSNKQLPCPVVGYGIGRINGINCVCVDNYQGGWDLAHFLVTKGQSNFVFVMPTNPTSITYDLISGLNSGLDLFDLKLQKTITWSVATMEPLKNYLAEYKKDTTNHLTLIVLNCAMAREIHLLAQFMGFKIPEDISIVSFIRRSFEDKNCAISCMDFSHEIMAQRVFELLSNSDICEHQSCTMLKMQMFEKSSIRNL